MLQATLVHAQGCNLEKPDRPRLPVQTDVVGPTRGAPDSSCASGRNRNVTSERQPKINCLVLSGSFARSMRPWESEPLLKVCGTHGFPGSHGPDERCSRPRVDEGLTTWLQSPRAFPCRQPESVLEESVLPPFESSILDGRPLSCRLQLVAFESGRHATVRNGSLACSSGDGAPHPSTEKLLSGLISRRRE
jgi:hypothetical protein